MALTKPSERKAMADEESPVEVDGPDEPQGEAGAVEPKSGAGGGKPKSPGGGGGGRTPAPRGGAGFFHIYKNGQGYWTRMGTAITAAMIGAFTAYNLFVYVPTLLPTASIPQGLSPAEETAFTTHQQL